MALVLLLILGVVAGVLGSLLGLGGGVVLVPALLSLSGLWGEVFTPQEAVGTSLAVVAATGLSSTLAYLRHGKVDVSSALFFFLASGPGAAVGVWANRFLDGQRFFLLFGLLLVSLFFLLAVRDRIRPRPGRWTVVRTLKTPEGEVTYGYRRRVALPVAFAVGFLSGLFGIGGGALMVPVMILAFAFPPHVATATSLLVILLSSAIGTAVHTAYGHVHWHDVLILAPGAWFGAMAGARLALRLSDASLVFVFRLALLALAGRMFWEGLA